MRVDSIGEKVEAWREAENKAIEKYCSLIDVLTEISNSIDGYPASTAETVAHIRSDILRLDNKIQLIEKNEDVEPSSSKKPMLYILFFLSWLLAAGLGVLCGIAVSK